MTKLFGGNRKPEPHIELAVEGQPAIEDPDLEMVLRSVRGIERPSPTYLCLTHRNGDYLQLVGSRPWCRVELRTQKPLNHFCAFQDTPNPKYEDGVIMTTGAGEITMAHDEWFLLKDAAEIFSAFYKRKEFPVHVQWRSMNAMMGL